jgi:hypothetical protein
MHKLGLIAFAFCGIAQAQSVGVTVDTTSQVHWFNPQIFGVAFGDSTRNQQMGYTVDRWGGNSTSRYNWRGPAHNAGSDYFFLGYGSDQTDDADAFLTNARNAGAQTLLSVPTIGYVEKFDSNDPTAVHWGYSQAAYGAQTLDECRYYDPNPPFWCHGDAGNGLCDGNVNATSYCVNGQIVGNATTDTSIPYASSDNAAWIAHLQSTSRAADFYALDNEVMIWNSTHRDVHPDATSYAEVFGSTGTPSGYTVDHAVAIKTQQPNAMVTGPVTYGYCDLFGSAVDNCLDGTDRQAHSGLPFIAWYLQQVCTYQQQHGTRLVDYLDLHWYPGDPNPWDPSYGSGGQIYSNDEAADTVARRLKSLRELWDSAWVAESWIQDLGDDPTWHYSKPGVIPRVRAWIDTYCPGTKLAITEYAWDQDATDSGAVAQAEALAIFAREGVDLATRWTAPASGSKAERGFQIFLNYDGAGAKVQGDSVYASSANIDQVGAYAFHDQRTMVLLTNKDTVAHDVTVTFNAAQSGTWKLYGFDGTNGVHQINTGSISGTALTLNGLTPMSANLLVVPDADEIFRNGFD